MKRNEEEEHRERGKKKEKEKSMINLQQRGVKNER